MTHNEFLLALAETFQQYCITLPFNQTWKDKTIEIIKARFKVRLEREYNRSHNMAEQLFFKPEKPDVSNVDLDDLLCSFKAKVRLLISQFNRVVIDKQIEDAKAMSEQEVKALKTEPDSMITSCSDEFFRRLNYKQLFLMTCERLADACVSALFPNEFKVGELESFFAVIALPVVEYDGELLSAKMLDL